MSEAVVTREESKAVLNPAGDIVAARVPELRSILRTALNDGAREVVLDFTSVEMLDSSGIGLLVSAHNSVTKLGGHFQVIHASKEILELLHTMRIHQHFNISGE